MVAAIVLSFYLVQHAEYPDDDTLSDKNHSDETVYIIETRAAIFPLVRHHDTFYDIHRLFITHLKDRTCWFVLGLHRNFFDHRVFQLLSQETQVYNTGLPERLFDVS